MVFLIGILRAANPSATLTRGPPPLSGAVGLGSPVGELSSVSETEGVWFVEWQQLKAANGTPFAAARSTTPKGGQQGIVRIRLGAF